MKTKILTIESFRQTVFDGVKGIIEHALGIIIKFTPQERLDLAEIGVKV